MPSKATRPTVGAGVAGASGGTALLALVSTIPDSNPWKPILTFAAPTLAVAISALWLFVMDRLVSYLADKRIESELAKAVNDLRTIEADPNASETYKKDARNRVEALHILKLALHKKRMESYVNAEAT